MSRWPPFPPTFTRKCLYGSLLLCAVAAVSLCAGVRATSSPDTFTTHTLARDAFIAKVLYAEPKRLASNIGTDGAVGVNREWEAGTGNKLFIEEQRYAGDLVQDGIVERDPSLIERGIKVMKWGFKQQAGDGSFPATGDPFHSVSMFVEGVSRAVLSLQQADAAGYSDVIATYTPKIAGAAHWLQRADVEQVGRKHDAPYTHRRWILAAALGQTAKLIGDRSMEQRALAYAHDGLSMQQPDGINPEKGGYDVSYQCVGILMAERYLVTCPDRREQQAILTMIKHGSDWELSMINENGEVDVGASTRVGQETARSGKVKHVNTKELLEALSYATALSSDPRYRAKAALVARAQGW